MRSLSRLESPSAVFRPKRALCTRFETIAARSDTLDSPKLLACAAEPDMNVLIFYTKLGREFLYRDALVASSPQRGKNSGFKRTPSSAGLGFGGLCCPGFGGRGGRAPSSNARSAPDDTGFCLSAGVVIAQANN